MMIDKNIFTRLADTAKIEFTKKEEKQLTDDLNKTIEFIDTMNELDTEQVEPFLCLRTAKNAFREDIVTGSDRKGLLSQAPDMSDEYYVVPRTVE